MLLLRNMQLIIMLNCTPMICMIEANNFVERGILIFKFECLQLRDNFPIFFDRLSRTQNEARRNKGQEKISSMDKYIYSHITFRSVYCAV